MPSLLLHLFSNSFKFVGSHRPSFVNSYSCSRRDAGIHMLSYRFMSIGPRRGTDKGMYWYMVGQLFINFAFQSNLAGSAVQTFINALFRAPEGRNIEAPRLDKQGCWGGPQGGQQTPKRHYFKDLDNLFINAGPGPSRARAQAGPGS